ncbi:MAG: putative quinol monooxygenase [Pseudomonadota bacterium]|nr:putative quinol monooxygenase [Pseudomonadota bacterium]
MKRWCLALLLALFSLSSRAENAMNPHVPLMRMFEFTLAPEQVAIFMAAGERNVRDSVREEPGVLSMFVAADRDEPTRLYVIEVYRDQAAYDSHRQSPHFLAFLEGIEGRLLSRRVIETTPLMLGAKAFEWSGDW